MESKDAYYSAKNHVLIRVFKVVSWIAVVLGVILVIGGFGSHYDFLFPIGLGVLISSVSVFAMKYITMAALIYIFKNAPAEKV